MYDVNLENFKILSGVFQKAEVVQKFYYFTHTYVYTYIHTYVYILNIKSLCSRMMHRHMP
jgi:hypothetical protein